MVPILGTVWSNPQTWPLALLFLLLSGSLLVLLHLVINRQNLPGDAPPVLKGYPILGSLGFFGKRLEFLQRGQETSPNRLFSFYYGRHPIVALSGTQGRSLFYTTRALDLNAGFMMLFAARPNIDHIRHNRNDNIQPMFKKLLMRDRLATNLHYLTGDTHNALRAFDVHRPVDPFAVMYRLIYQLTHRTLGCHDVAEKSDLLETTMKHYSCIEESSPVQILFPELPTFAKVRKQWAGINLYWQFRKIIHDRRDRGIKGTDAMQVLMDDGMSEIEIASFIIGALFAGLINSGINAAWILAYLAKNPEWYFRCRDEIDAVVASHRQNECETAEDILPRVSIDEWETRFPTIDLCLRESLRLNVSGVAMRRNISSRDIKIPGTNQIIPAGAFAVYPVDEAHLDPAVFTDPYSFDPTRFLPNRAEDQKAPHSFLAFGGGLHPCLGMRFAKLSIYISTAYFMSYFDFYHCDKESGLPLAEALPTVDRNAIGLRLPTNVFLQCKPRF